MEAWFAVQAVANQVGPASNVGVRGIHWNASGGSPLYHLLGACVEGELRTTTGAPTTLEEARKPQYLDKAIRTRERAVAKRGGLKHPLWRPAGTGAHLVAAMEATPEGRIWLKGRRDPVQALRQMVRIADAYGREGINPGASLAAHHTLVGQPDRIALIREFPEYERARAKVLSRQVRTDEIVGTNPNVSPSKVVRLAISSGVTRAEARIILRALLDGRSKAKLILAVNEGARLVEQRGALKVAA